MLRDKVLEVLFRQEITQKELTARLRSSRSRMSEVLRKLEKQRLIVRKKVSQRTVLVSLNHSTTLRVGILRSSEYVHIVSALSELSDKIPYRIKIYDNSLEALKELMTGTEDIVASPLISGYFFHLIDRNIRPIAGVARGGSGLIRRNDNGKIGTTPLSRMDKDSREFHNYEQVYYKSIDDILRAYRKREIDAAQIWEPFLSMNNGTGSHPKGMCCCLFTLGKPTKSVDTFLEKYAEGVKRGFPEEHLKGVASAMSSLLDVEEKDVIASLGSYIFTLSISTDDVESQIKAFGLPLVREVEYFLERSSKVSV